jgi:hypothetical protein
MTNQNSKILTFALSLCFFIFIFRILEGFVWSLANKIATPSPAEVVRRAGRQVRARNDTGGYYPML